MHSYELQTNNPLKQRFHHELVVQMRTTKIHKKMLVSLESNSKFNSSHYRVNYTLVLYDIRMKHKLKSLTYYILLVDSS